MALFTYNIFNQAIRQGLPITTKRMRPKNPMQVLPPHLLCGDQFVAINNRWQNPPIYGEMLLRAGLERIEPAGKKPFFVFGRTANENEVLLFIETTPPKSFRPRIDINQLNAYTGIVGEGFESVVADRSTCSALLRCKDGANIYLFLPDGRVELIAVSNLTPHFVAQSQKQMAGLRIEQFERQLAEAVDNMSRQHGILGGAIRLLRATNNEQVLDDLSQFLADNVATLTDRMRRDVRYRLLEAGHRLAGTFLDGIDSPKVARIVSSESATKRAQADKKRRDRSEQDRARTMATKAGGTKGGDKGKAAGKKK